MNVTSIPLQNMPSQHAQPGGSIIPQPTTNDNASASHDTNPTPKRFANLVPIVKPFLRNVRDSLKYWFRPTISLIIYGLTLYTAYAAPNQHTLLGRVSASLGTWILAIFAKAGDICFAFAIEDTFDTIAWRKLKAKKRNFGSKPLEWFLSVTPSTGIEGLVQLLWRRSRLRRVLARHHEGLLGGQNEAQTSGNENASWERRWRDWWKRGSFSRWPLARLLFVVVMIPGPGIILMANIDQATVYFDVRSMNVSAGLATFDPAIANVTRNVISPLVSRYIQVMLQDRSLTWPVDPVDPVCSSSKNCNSSLIAGPYSTTSPWPFLKTNETVGLDGFRIKDVPVYQVDMWDSTWDSLSFSESRDCATYGGLDPTHEYSTLICIHEHDTQRVLAAAWASCQAGYSQSNGTCLDPGRNDGWGIFFHFYRRTATIVFSRSDLDILSVDHLSDPQPQNITPAALFTTLDAILYRPDRADETLKFYDVRSAEYLLTQTIGVQLWSSLFDTAASFNIGRDWLRNLVTLPVYVYQPTFLELAPYLQPLTADNGTMPQPNLPRENYVEGSYCIVDKRSIPGRGTVYAYTAVAGLLLAFVFIAKARALLWEDLGKSDFPILDTQILLRVVDKSPSGNEIDLRERLEAVNGEHSTSKVLDQIPNLRIGLR